ncbi:MAG: hypothetical protein NUW21_06060, partial [Elusimicrobia bacterium]|nr:hypothetical protein [Elusimicrobiota bacterium]
MNIKIISLAASVAILSSCGGHRKTARVEPVAPTFASAVSPLSVEPLGCPVYAGDDRPDYDAQALECIDKWMGEAREYLDKGGKPTKYTSRESIESYGATVQTLRARVSKRLAEAPAAVIAAQDSQQHYLTGIIHFQKGDVEGARREWVL